MGARYRQSCRPATDAKPMGCDAKERGTEYGGQAADRRLQRPEMRTGKERRGVPLAAMVADPGRREAQDATCSTSDGACNLAVVNRVVAGRGHFGCHEKRGHKAAARVICWLVMSLLRCADDGFLTPQKIARVPWALAERRPAQGACPVRRYSASLPRNCRKPRQRSLALRVDHDGL